MKAFKSLFALPILFLALGALAQGPHLKWETPTKYENGDELTQDMIGGYEIRFTDENGETEFLILPEPEATSYVLDDLEPGVYTFEIAVYDVIGLYSAFVDLDPADVSEPNRPAPVEGFIYQAVTYPDPAEECANRERCRVKMLSARYGSGQ